MAIYPANSWPHAARNVLSYFALKKQCHCKASPAERSSCSALSTNPLHALTACGGTCWEKLQFHSTALPKNKSQTDQKSINLYCKGPKALGSFTGQSAWLTNLCFLHLVLQDMKIQLHIRLSIKYL